MSIVGMVAWPPTSPTLARPDLSILPGAGRGSHWRGDWVTGGFIRINAEDHARKTASPQFVAYKLYEIGKPFQEEVAT